MSEPMTSVPVPAAMPSEALSREDQQTLERALTASAEHMYDIVEPDIATALATKIMALDWMDRRKWSCESQADRHGEIQEMINAAITPILAEKEREIERLDGERAIYFDMSAKAEARALAGERARDVTIPMIAAAWDAWHSRHGGKLGPGPGFKEAIAAAIRAQGE